MHVFKSDCTKNAEIYFLIDLFQDGEVEVSNEVLKIDLTRGADARIVIEGTEVLQISDATRACAMLMGLIYALNLT